MIKRTIEISKEPYHLAVQLDQLKLHRLDNHEVVASIPCEDIGLLIVDHPSVSYSHAALARLIEFGASVVFCDRKHLPTGVLLPMADHTEVVWRLQLQVEVSKPVQKQIWRQLVAAKIAAQGANIEDADIKRKLFMMSKNVRSGDPDNMEAQAAKIYWAAWLPDYEKVAAGNGWLEKAAFRRDPEGCDSVNAQLNYGYAILRAAIARALVSAGLHPTLGIKHANRSNAFCLADDMIEPLRPMVDAAVRDLYRSNHLHMSPFVKTKLLNLLTKTVQVGDQHGPLMVALHRVTASLVRCLGGEDKFVTLPTWTETPLEPVWTGEPQCT